MAHRVFVGLSGGVDSAVAAALLQEQGFDVVGAYIKIWQPEFIECTWQEDRLDAMRVAAALGIPFKEIDLSDEYKKDVVDAMVRDYARGITPNPDVLCNRCIKFGAFAQWARGEGADMIATGHYAQKREESGHIELLRARDPAKDQSYFLYRLDQKDLSRAIFPVGGMLKSEVRAHAKRFGLPVANKPDSQGLCFVGEVSMPEFLARFIPIARGPVVDGETVIGEHEGAAFYTIGQRHGFSTAKAKKAGPYYVTRIDVATNTVHVSTRREDAARDSVTLDDVHWVDGEPAFPFHALAQARYHEPPVRAAVSKEGNRITVAFKNPHIASPGQSLVLYLPGQKGDGDACLGGGILCA
jgi:tRNA-specific 2-thiouridylase